MDRGAALRTALRISLAHHSSLFSVRGFNENLLLVSKAQESVQEPSASSFSTSKRYLEQMLRRLN